MAADAVAEVHAPGQRSGRAVGVIGEAGEETADASDGDADAQRDGVEVASALRDAELLFEPLDGNEASDQGADDGFSAHQIDRVAPVGEGHARVFEPVEELAAQGGANGSGSDDRPAEFGGQGIAGTAAEPEIDAEGSEVGKSFKEPVRMKPQGAQPQVNRKLHRGPREPAEGRY